MDRPVHNAVTSVVEWSEIGSCCAVTSVMPWKVNEMACKAVIVLLSDAREEENSNEVQ